MCGKLVVTEASTQDLPLVVLADPHLPKEIHDMYDSRSVLRTQRIRRKQLQVLKEVTQNYKVHSILQMHQDSQEYDEAFPQAQGSALGRM